MEHFNTHTLPQPNPNFYGQDV